LPFKPSAIKRPPASVNVFTFCTTRRYTAPPSPVSPTGTTAHSPPLTHAPAYQVDHLQALEPPQVGAQRRNVVVRQLRLHAA
jgi:hypothetical protein